MEASTGVPSPLAGRTVSRPHYKALYLTAVSLNDRLRGELADAKDGIITWENLHRKCEHDLALSSARLLATETKLWRWATAAVIEALALIIVAILLLAKR